MSGYRSGHSFDDGATLGTAVCVVGSGPAGLTVAAELVRAGTDVVVVETGGRAYEPAAQELSAAEMSAQILVDLVANRRRQIGGNANVWVVKIVDLELGVRYAPLDPIDFEARDGDRAQASLSTGPSWSPTTRRPR